MFRQYKRFSFLFILQISTAFAQPNIFTPDWSIASALTEMGNPPIAMGISEFIRYGRTALFSLIAC